VCALTAAEGGVVTEGNGRKQANCALLSTSVVSDNLSLLTTLTTSTGQCAPPHTAQPGCQPALKRTHNPPVKV